MIMHSPTLQLTAGIAMLSFSGVLLAGHARAIVDVQDVSVPLIAQLPQLERRLDVLQEQVEVTELASATTVDAYGERVTIFALPEETDLDRLIAVFEIVREALSREDLVASMSDITLGQSAEASNGAVATPLSVTFTAHENGVKKILMLMRLAGVLTVGDALTEEELALLIERVESENPVGVVSLEQFLSVDLLDYVQNPRIYEEQLQRSFSSTSFLSALQNVTRTSLLRDAREFLAGSIGQALRTYKLWPLQMMSVSAVTLESGSAPGWYRMQLQASVYSRE